MFIVWLALHKANNFFTFDSPYLMQEILLKPNLLLRKISFAGEQFP